MVSVEELVVQALTKADWIAQSGKSAEVDRRDSVRTTYYAAFHAARQYAQKQDPTIRENVPHTDLWEWFHGRTGIGKIKHDGKQLFNLRKSADYVIDKDFPHSTSQAIQVMKYIVGTLSQDVLTEALKTANNSNNPSQSELGL